MKYEFEIVLSGTGETVDEAWRDATEAFAMDPGAVPDSEDVRVYEDE